MRVVNASPLIHLSRLSLLELLREPRPDVMVVIPSIVLDEVLILVPNHGDQQAAPFGASWSKGATRTSDEAIDPDLDLLDTTGLGHELQVALVVLCTEEGRLAAVTPLGDVMRNAGSNDTCQASHFRKRPGARTRRKNQAWCPRNPLLLGTGLLGLSPLIEARFFMSGRFKTKPTGAMASTESIISHLCPVETRSTNESAGLSENVNLAKKTYTRKYSRIRAWKRIVCARMASTQLQNASRSPARCVRIWLAGDISSESYHPCSRLAATQYGFSRGRDRRHL